MKTLKNILLGVFVLLFLTMLLFSFIKASDAQRAMSEAEEQRRIAEEYFTMAQMQEKLALECAAEAHREKQRADDLSKRLANCSY